MADEILMPCGRCHGRPLSQVEPGELFKAARTMPMAIGVQAAIEDELDRRFIAGARDHHFEFGSHAGVPLEQLPPSYLKWVVANVKDLWPLTVTYIETILLAPRKSTWSPPAAAAKAVPPPPSVSEVLEARMPTAPAPRSLPAGQLGRNIRLPNE